MPPRQQPPGGGEAPGLDELLAALENTGGQQVSPLIGVPEDFQIPVQVGVRPEGQIVSVRQAERRPQLATAFRVPVFREGDEFTPASYGAARIAELQRDLIAAGLISSTATVRFGVWDSTSRNAFAELLAFANQRGISSVQMAMQMWNSTREEFGGQNLEGEGREPLVVRRSNPDELRRVFRQVVTNTLGQGWSAERIESMVNTYLAEEERGQRSAFDLSGPGSAGGTITDIPSPEVFAQEQVEEEDPTGVAARGTLAQGQRFFDLLEAIE